MRSKQVTFGMARDRERAFLETYMPDAWDRFQRHDAFESGWFWRFGQTSQHQPIELEDGTVLDGGGVILVLNGDPSPEPILDGERDRWQKLEAEGFLDTWEVKGFQPTYENARQKMHENFGPEGGELCYRLRPLAIRTTLGMLETFEEDLPAVADATDANPRGIGDWVLIHFLLKQSGHDWYEEIDACRQAIQNRLRSLAAFYDRETAIQELDAVIDDLEAARADLASTDG